MINPAPEKPGVELVAEETIVVNTSVNAITTKATTPIMLMRKPSSAFLNMPGSL
jgi:hypothetical protein